jgi:WD40 repeat protein
VSTAIWRAQTGQQLQTLRHDHMVMAVAFSPDGRWLATGTYGNRAMVGRCRMPPTSSVSGSLQRMIKEASKTSGMMR